MLEFTDHELRLIAVLDAAKTGDVRALVEMLGDVDVRYDVLRKLGKLGDPAAAAGVVRMLQAGDPYVRAKAADVLGEIGAADAVADLVGVARSDEVWWVRSWAIGALGEIGDTSCVPQLIGLLDDPHFHVVISTLVALGRLGDPSALEAFERTWRSFSLTDLNLYGWLSIMWARRRLRAAAKVAAA